MLKSLINFLGITSLIFGSIKILVIVERVINIVDFVVVDYSIIYNVIIGKL